MKGNLYLLWGKDHFFIDQKIKDILQEQQEDISEPPELIYIDPDELNPHQLREQLEFSPLFTLQRIVVIKRPYWLGKGKKRGSKNDDYVKVINDYLDYASPGQTLILTTDEPDRSNALFKRLNREGIIIECRKPEDKEYSQWINNEFVSRGASCSSGLVKRLTRSGQDGYYIYNLIEKLCLQVKGRKISEQDLDEDITAADSITVFRLTDSLLKKDLKGSLKAYYQLLDQGEHPLLFLSMTARQLGGMAKVKGYQEKGLDNREIAERTGMKDFMIRRYKEAARIFSWNEIEKCFKGIMEVDFKIKNTSQDGAILVETLIIDICEKSTG